jgi:hypothetical protein
MSLVSVTCCQVEGSATGRLPLQRSSSECGASVCVCVCVYLNAIRCNNAPLHYNEAVKEVRLNTFIHYPNYIDMDMSYTRVLHIKVAYRVPHK